MSYRCALYKKAFVLNAPEGSKKPLCVVAPSRLDNYAYHSINKKKCDL